MNRRRALVLAATIGLGVGSHSHANRTFANTKPIRLVVGFAPGGAADVFARMLAQFASQQLGRSVIVDNRPGAAAIIGADHVAKSVNDGTTLLLSFAEALVSNPTLYRSLPYQPARDFDFVCLLAQGPLVIAVNKSVGVDSLDALLAVARKRSLNWGSWGAGSHGHLLCEGVNRAYQTQIQHVPYKGEAPTIQALLGGEIQIAAGSIGGMRPHLMAGTLRAIGTIGSVRSLALPDTRTLYEQGARDAAFTTLGWVGLVAPKGLDAAIARQWLDLVRAFFAREETRRQFLNYGFEPRVLDAAAFRKLFDADSITWAQLIRQSGVQLD